MISVEDAKHIILNNSNAFGVDEVPFLSSMKRILKEDIIADRDFPPFNRVSMDGIAINFRFFEYGVRDFKIEGIQPAGSEQETMLNAAHCYEVMTGAVLPNNCDTVIRYEDVTINNGMATVNLNTIIQGQNVHDKGKDRKKGDLLIPKNIVISPAEIGVLATVGKSTVKVAKQPKVMIVSTGDELVGVEETPEAHQIRRSNVFTLVSLLERLHIPSETAHITDEKAVLKEKIASFLHDYDVLLFSGAVSKGKFDFLPEVLDELGVKKLFHKVTQRPGKPFWFGVADPLSISGRDGNMDGKNEETETPANKTVVFAFPGNPISTYVNCLAYFYPWFYKSVQIEQEEVMAVLAEDVNFKPNLTYFLQVQLKSENGNLKAYPVKGNGSGDLASLTLTDGFIVLPKSEETVFKKGNVYPIIFYRSY